ncbi:MAG: threonylcarbamoyl-AMP synthase [Bauldia sp.]|nr:threonylcarbamoyl-AMP synthase [Bauldia sp.]
MSREAPRAAGLATAVEALRAGQLVGMPTETVYGLAANAADGAAVARIFAAKGRPRFNPLIVHVASLAAAETLIELGAAGQALARAFWPGPLTLVAPRRPGAPVADLATAGLPTLAVRVPAHPVARDLIAASGMALAAPSANRSGHVSPTLAYHVADDLGDAVAVILDAGAAPVGVESTVIGLAGPEPVLLRPGGIPRTDIEAVLGRALVNPAADAAVAGPGMLAQHYAPAVPLRLAATDVRSGESLLGFGPEFLPGSDMAKAIVNLSETGDLVEAAASLFTALRRLEAVGAPIAAMPIPDHGLGEAINDRLRRAAAKA